MIYDLKTRQQFVISPPHSAIREDERHMRRQAVARFNTFHCTGGSDGANGKKNCQWGP
jgi:hypothetical protein